MKYYYGLPYKGSKNSIVLDLIDKLPSADTYYDLFVGGGAMLHGAILSGKFNSYVINDIKSITIKAFKMALNGTLGASARWVSREEFQQKKKEDPYCSLLYSFGNDERTYFCGKYIEPYYKALFDAYTKGNCSFFTKNLNIKLYASVPLSLQLNRLNETIKTNYIKWFFRDKADLRELEEKRKNNELSYLNENEYNYMFLTKKKDWDKCEPLVRLDRIRMFERLLIKTKSKIKVFNTSYDDVKIKPNSVIYCDPPYFNTSAYEGKILSQKIFDFEKFYNFCESHDNIFISEYYMPADRFKLVYSVAKRVLINAYKDGVNNKEECLFAPINNETKQNNLFDF